MTSGPIDPHAMWRVLVDALDRLPDATLEDEDHWVQLRTPSSRHTGHNVILRAKLTAEEADARIDAVLAEHAERGSGIRWVVDADSSPADLAQRLTARGLRSLGRGIGMVRRVESPPHPEPPPGVRVVRATVDDCERLGEIISAAWGLSPAFGRTMTDVARRAFAGAGGDLAYWLAHDGETLVGSSMLRVLPGLGYLQGAGVVPSARGRGIYQALTWVRIAELHRRGIERVVIWANAQTSGPVAHKLGFVPVTEAHFFERHADDPST
ncbi:GNAT family N-acetyltransferase [Paraliomyxa miuraensis]|uniref:GNAT family N-acetyltransferase n=1 Tax=Paraliomyxa miuraensis TaxID=376150 RepID=UPI002254AFF0|nr:GNAT family N-acetyltransferase [Paraliomyxa miuraensis]MCX4243965.1 GNAT family N-acetyltransferase [Paraliomyxa miuraensis]